MPGPAGTPGTPARHRPNSSSLPQVLAKKVYTLYSLAVQQLSKQDHYDFGLRALTSLLRYAGKKRRVRPDLSDEEVGWGSWGAGRGASGPGFLASASTMGGGWSARGDGGSEVPFLETGPPLRGLLGQQATTPLPRFQILLMAMKDMNIAKLTSSDVPLFNAIIHDLFPGIECPVIDYGKVSSSAHPAGLREPSLSSSPRKRLRCCRRGSGGSFTDPPGSSTPSRET